MKFTIARSIFLSLMASAGIAITVHAQVAVNITGSHGNSEGSCTEINKLFGTFDCTYGGTNAVGTAGGWSGPSLGGTYYTSGSIGDDTGYTPVPGDGKIEPTITGTLTITGAGAGATIGGTIVVGPAVRSIGTGQTTRAVQGWSSITHTLAATAVDTAVANGDGGFDYIIGSAGFPEEICLAGGGACFGLHEAGAITTTGPVNSWGVGGVGGTKPSVGISALANFAGPAATGTTDQTNVGASTTAVIADGTCTSNDATVPLDCDENAILWGTEVGKEDPGFDNLIMAISTNAAGDITSGRAYWTQDYRINLGASVGDNSDASGTFSFTGTVAPACADFAATVIQDSSNNVIDAPANCTNFGGAVTITIVTPPTNGTASVDGANNIVYTPNASYSGPDTLTYNGDDGTDNDDGLLTLTVEADVLPVAPDGTITLSTQGVDPATVSGTLDVATLPTYSEGNAPTTVTVAVPVNGTATVAGTIITYTLAGTTFAGSEGFLYTLVDSNGDVAQGTVTVDVADLDPVVADGSIVTDENEASAPEALAITAGNGSPAQHTLAVTTDGTNGSCSLTAADATGQVIYTPDADYVGADSCVVTLTDGNGDSDTATIAIQVQANLGVIVIDGGSSAVDPASLALLSGLLPLLRRRRKAAAARVAMAAAAGVLAAPAAMAANDNWDWDYDGLYLGAGVTGTSLETSSSFNSSLQQLLDDEQIEASGSFEDFPIGGQIYIGWMFNNYFGLEGRWSGTDDGESDILLVEGQAPNEMLTNIGKLEASIDGWTLYGVANWPIAPRWDIYGKLGYTDQNVDFSGSLDGAEGGGSFSGSDDDSGVAAALGARWRIARHWAATVEGEYLGVDFDSTLDEPWRASLNLEYWFGGHEIPMAAAAPVAAAAPAKAAPPPPPPPPPAPKDTDRDGVTDGNDLCPDTPRGDRVSSQGCSCDVSRQLAFKFDSAELTDKDKEILDEMADNLTRLKFVSGVIVGHTDSIGDEAYNQDLSERRAQAVADYLRDKGIGGGRMEVIGRGESEPIGDNKTAEGRALNRRVVAKRTDCDQ